MLDEPANGLDPQGIRWLRDFLRSLAAEGRTMLVSSHVLAEVAQTVDDVVIIAPRPARPAGADRRGARAAGRRRRGSAARTRDRLRGAARAGIEATASAKTARWSTRPPERIGEIAAANGIVLHELTRERATLEEVFLELTERASTPSVSALLASELLKLRTARGLWAFLLVLVAVIGIAAAGHDRLGARSTERAPTTFRPTSSATAVALRRADPRDHDRHHRVPARHDHDRRSSRRRSASACSWRRLAAARDRVGLALALSPFVVVAVAAAVALRVDAAPMLDGRRSRAARPHARSRSLLAALFGAAVGRDRAQPGRARSSARSSGSSSSSAAVGRVRTSRLRRMSASTCPFQCLLDRARRDPAARARAAARRPGVAVSRRLASRCSALGALVARPPRHHLTPLPCGDGRAGEAGRGGRAPHRLARLRRERRRAPERLRRLRPPRAAGRPRARARDEGEARLRRGAHDRGARAGAAARRGAVRALPRLRRLPLPGSRLRRQVAAKEAQVRDALVRIGGIAEPPLEPIVPAESPFFYRNKLEYSFTQTPAGPALGFHKAGPLGRGARDREVLADDRPRQRDPQRRARLGARGGARRLRPGRRTPATCATSSSARAATPGRRS